MSLLISLPESFKPHTLSYALKSLDPELNIEIGTDNIKNPSAVEFAVDWKNSEVKMLSKICGKLGFPPDSSKMVLSWVSELVKLNNDRNKIIEELKELKPVFV